MSPASGLEVRNPIVTGSQSLVSTLSDEQQMADVIHQANIEHQENQQRADQITDDIFKSLMDELKLELDLLLLTIPRKEQPEPGTFTLLTSLALNASGRFLIFERRGIKTDLFAIERYVEEVLEEVLSKYCLADNFRGEKQVLKSDSDTSKQECQRSVESAAKL